MYRTFSYIATFGAGFVGSHYLRNKTNERNYRNQDQIQGRDKSMINHAMDHGVGMVQNFAPLRGIHQHLCGFHGYSGEMDRQVIAHHYCAHLNEDVHQCLIYDDDKIDARLIGVEYIVTEKIFKNLPPEEKKLWHSHIYEVKSGLLIAPEMPEVPDTKLMSGLINTYGKTFHFWQVDKGDDLPYGIPKLMMAFTDDNQVSEKTLQSREMLKPSLKETKKNRASIQEPVKDKQADNWLNGESVILKAVEVPTKKLSK